MADFLFLENFNDCYRTNKREMAGRFRPDAIKVVRLKKQAKKHRDKKTETFVIKLLRKPENCDLESSPKDFIAF
jgi:hypothetical protein